MKYIFEKHFTLEQANALIPHVRKLFGEVHALLNRNDENPESTGFHGHRPHQPKGNGNGNGRSNGNGNENGNVETFGSSSDYVGWSEEKRHEAAYRLLNALQTQGIVIQDVERGLIDFPSIQNEQEVFLCYELKDGNSIEFFHQLETGYSGRQKITENNSG